jgi:hypothetical protein
MFVVGLDHDMVSDLGQGSGDGKGLIVWAIDATSEA